MKTTTVEITDKNYQQVLSENKTVVVDFWAAWCGPCRAIGPVIDELSGEYEGRAVIGKLNVDEHQKTAADFGITSIPTVLFFSNGKLADSVKGAVPKSILEAKLQSIVTQQ